MAGKDNYSSTYEENKKEEKSVDATDTRKKATQKTINLQQPNGSVETVNYFPAPRHHATHSVTRNAVKASAMARSSDKHQLPSSATQEALSSATWSPVPSGGIASLADSLFPEDVEDDDAMDQHVYDILTMNRDIIRDDTSLPNAQTLVRVPKR
jgi:hypothetical protein